MRRHDKVDTVVVLDLETTGLYPDAPNHKPGTLVAYRQLPQEGSFHRAMADAGMTAHLWLDMLDDLAARYPLEGIPFMAMRELTRLPGVAIDSFLRELASARA